MANMETAKFKGQTSVWLTIKFINNFLRHTPTATFKRNQESLNNYLSLKKTPTETKTSSKVKWLNCWHSISLPAQKFDLPILHYSDRNAKLIFERNQPKNKFYTRPQTFCCVATLKWGRELQKKLYEYIHF